MILGYEEEKWKELGGECTAREIMQQPEVWLKTYDLVKALEPQIKAFHTQYIKEGSRIIFAGAGSSDYIGTIISHTIGKKLKAQVMAVATTDIVSNPEYSIDRDQKTVLVSFARSGNSPESVGAFRLFQKHVKDIRHVVITCNKDGNLAQIARKDKDNFVLVLPEETNDIGFAMTSSFSSMLLAALLFFDIRHIDQNKKYVEAISREGKLILDTRCKQVKALLTENVERVIYLGSGCLRGLAKELALKNMELTNGAIPAMHESILGFRHGPKTFMNNHALVLILSSTDPYANQYEKDLIDEIDRDSGSHKLAVLRGIQADCHEPQCVQLTVETEAVPEAYMLFGYLLYGQMLALFNSVRMGVTPDNPCPGGAVNRVVKGVILYDECYTGR